MKWIHLETLIIAVLAASVTNQSLGQLDASVLLCAALSGLLLVVVLIWLEQYFKDAMNGLYLIFGKIPVAWSLMFFAGSWSYIIAVIFQVPTWAMIVVVCVTLGVTWRFAC